MCQFPEAFAAVKSDPALIPGLVDEAVRWITPVKHFMRSATEDTRLRDREIAKGDWLMLCYPSGNRDEEAIENPNDFIIDRARPRQHLSFGFGIHRCVGNRLAELQLSILWDEILKRDLEIEVLTPPTRAYSSLLRSITALPVRIAA